MMKAPTSPLVWAENYPPKSWRDRLFLGFPWLGPDLRFFKELKEQQAARTEEVMAAWSDDQERRVALSLGQILRKHWGWEKPYFVPADRTIVVVCGPDYTTFFEVDVVEVYEDFNEQLGVKFKPSIWERLVNWDNPTGCFGEMVHNITTELRVRSLLIPDAPTV